MRLTKLNKLSREIEKLGLPQQLYKKLYEYEEAEEQGTLVRLPCALKSFVYEVIFPTVVPRPVVGFDLDEDGKLFIHLLSLHYYEKVNVSEIGKTIFLTEAEALQALKERKNQ